MPDHDELLPGFRDVAVTPLPAAEVRARGDRLRRRRTTLTVLGAAASVALVAGVVGVVTSPGDQVQPSPAPATTSPSPSATPVAGERALIPADFPLGAGLPGNPAVDTRLDATTSIGLCDANVPAADGIEGIAVSSEDDAGSAVRNLEVYSSAAEARAVVTDAQAAVAACPRDTGSGGALELRYDPVPYASGDRSFAFSEQKVTAGAPDRTYYHLVNVGDAVLFSMTYVTGRAAQMPYDVAAGLQPVVEAMTVFSSEEALPCNDCGSDIPQDFPLDIDQVAMEGDGGQMRGPSPDEDGLSAQLLCGAPVWSDYPAERLASTATGPEYADIRELRVYPTTDEAAEEITRLRERLVSTCPGQQVDGAGRLVHALIEADTGYDSVTWADYYTQGLGGGPVQFTRVGRAVLGVALHGEFSEASLDGADEPVTAMTLKIAPAMCLFTEDGCGGSSEPELLQIGPDGMGPFRMGMTLAAARVAGGTVVAKSRCTSLEWNADALPRVSVVVDPDLGVVSLAADADAITPEGITTGSTYDELVAAYPEAEGSRSLVTVDVSGEDRFYRFDLSQGRVVWIALVAQDQTCVS